MPEGLRRALRAFLPCSGPPPRVAGGRAADLREGLASFHAGDPERFHRLFLRGLPLGSAPAHEAVLEACAEAGVTRRGAFGMWLPCVRLFPIHGAFVATDLLSRDDEDQVFSLMLEQVYLIDRMEIAPGERLLELCVGSGVNAVFASGRAAGVVGVDVSERALAFAAFNTALNPGACAVELRRGSLFGPLGVDERFDVILVNPPFEPVPRGARHFLHSAGGEDGLDVVRSILPEVPARLRSGGRFEIVTWTPSTGDDTLLGRLLAAQFPGRRTDLDLLDDAPLDARIEAFRDAPGYDAWRDRLRAAGHTRIRLVWARVHDAPGRLETSEPRERVESCTAIVREWSPA